MKKFGQMLEKNLSKSGVSHRLSSIVKIAKELENE